MTLNFLGYLKSIGLETYFNFNYKNTFSGIELSIDMELKVILYFICFYIIIMQSKELLNTMPPSM